MLGSRTPVELIEAATSPPDYPPVDGEVAAALASGVAVGTGLDMGVLTRPAGVLSGTGG